MKNSLFFYPLFALLFAPVFAFAQWSPNTTSTLSSIHREGSVGIGLEESPYARLHVRQEIRPTLPGQEVGFIPTLRLHRDVNTGSWQDGTYTWDFFANEALGIYAGDGTTSSLAMFIRSTGVDVAGQRLKLGYGGTTSEDNMTIGYGNSLNGHYITFNGTYGEGLWQGPNGKAVIHSYEDGSLFFLTQPAGGSIGPGENRRLSIRPEGTVIVGDSEQDQTLSISARTNPILRFNRADTGTDYEVLNNSDGDLEFRGGTDGEGTDLSTNMLLKANGRLLIGTTENPSDLNGGETDISDYRLYVEGGILTKEIRVREIWADYVFDDDYELLSLNQVKDHIDEYGHLHNTPSAEEIDRQGLELGGMMVNQQEKIEEIFLHLIELNDKLASLQQENQSLRKQLKAARR
ncbi:MAG: hypothetical protein AAFO03_15365 [Bacteroidota bacterium]